MSVTCADCSRVNGGVCAVPENCAVPVTADAQRDFHPVGSRPCCAFPTADVQRDLAEVIDRHAARGTTVPDLAAALLPTVRALIADAEKRAAAAAWDKGFEAGSDWADDNFDGLPYCQPVNPYTAALDPSGAAEATGP